MLFRSHPGLGAFRASAGRSTATRARVVKVIQRASDTIVGTLQAKGHVHEVVADDTRFPQRVHVRMKDSEAKGQKPLPGWKVVVRIKPWASRTHPLEGVIVESLGQRSGPVFANVRAGDLASYIFIALAKQLPPSAEHTQAAVIGDRLYVKALVKLSDFGGAGALGPLAGFLADRDTVRFGGTFEMIRPGLAQFHVQEIRIHDLSVPRALIPKLVGTMGRGARPAGTAPDALPLATPPYVGDVRVGQGRVTLYKSVP